MPYIISATGSKPVAVATLEEREVEPKLREMLPNEDAARLIAIAAEIARMPESGGTVGPLPDGTMIEVEQVEWQTLEDSAPGYITEQGVLDAYNARRGMSRAILIALVALVLLPSSASAYPGERPAPALVQRLAVKADAFWHVRKVDSCASAHAVLMAPSLLDDDDQDGDVELEGTGDGPGLSGTSKDQDGAGRGTPQNCGMWVADWLVKDTLNPDLFGTAIELCTTIYHEAGHTGGLPHTKRGLMAPWGGVNPFECRVWARRFEARKAHARWKRESTRRRGVGAG